MPLGRYRILHPTIALFQEDGRHVARTVPPGAFISVDRSAFGNKIVEVIWDGKQVMMFRLDLLHRSELVIEESDAQ